MTRRYVALASSSVLALWLSSAWPAAASEEGSTREYEVRLAAHRRELIQREADLAAARTEIRDLRKRIGTRSVVEAPAPAKPDPVEVEVAVTAPAPPADELPPAADSTATTIASLQRDLEVERENRSTVEQELRRLSAESAPTESLETLRRSLDGASAEILLLTHRAAEERHAREALEVALERARTIAAITPSDGWLDRFDATMKERREQTVRLEEQLREANEAIVSLRARLEATSTGRVDEAALQALQEENAKLRAALGATEQANRDLRAQAELAAHLAEMLYSEQR